MQEAVSVATADLDCILVAATLSQIAGALSWLVKNCPRFMRARNDLVYISTLDGDAITDSYSVEI